MLRNLTLGQYVPGHSFLHRLDPRVKLLVLVAFMAAMFMVQSSRILLLSGFLLLVVSIVAGFSLSFMMRGLRLIWILALFTFLFNACLIPGESVFKFAFLSITLEGLERGGAMALRLFLLVLATSLLTLSTSPILLTDAMEKLLSPFQPIGVPAHELAMVSTIALRFVPTLAMETERIMKSQMARGASLDRGGPLARVKALVPIMVPLFVSAFRHAEDLALAMEARCYHGGQGRTRLRELAFRWQDGLALLISLLFLSAFVGADHWIGA